MPSRTNTETEQPVANGFPEAFGPRVVPVAADSTLAINDICTCYHLPITLEQPVVFRTPPRRISIEDVIAGLSSIDYLLPNTSNDWFTIRQLGGAWVGRGSANFVDCLQTIGYRLEEADFEIFQTSFGVSLIRFRDGFLLICLEIDGETGAIDSGMIGFLTDGHPLDGGRYREVVEAFGMSGLSHSRDVTIDSVSIRPRDTLLVDVHEQIVQDTRENDPMVNGLIVENPLVQFEDIHDEILRRAPGDYGNGRHPYAQLATYEHAYVQLNHLHQQSEDLMYTIQEIRVADLSRTTDSQDVLNLNISVRWY